MVAVSSQACTDISSSVPRSQSFGFICCALTLVMEQNEEANKNWAWFFF